MVDLGIVCQISVRRGACYGFENQPVLNTVFFIINDGNHLEIMFPDMPGM